jgi:beta-glucanase (GH16 family)
MRYGSRHSVLAPKSSLEERGMRLATACSRRIAEGLSRYWHRAGRLGRLAAVGLALCLAVLCATAAGISLLPASADSSAPAALAVPGGMLAAVKSAALSCPELSPPRLAAQLMAASRFNPDAVTPGGGSGVAGLTAAQWQQWAPAPGAARSDATANIVALAHDVCNLAGQVRAGHAPGDLWPLALAAFHSGLPAVIAARGIPPAAASYVATVAAYATWYAQQRQFGGAAVTPARPSPHATASPSPAPAPKASPALAPKASPAPANGEASAASGWRLVWSDEFNGPAGSPPDPSKWSHDIGGNGWGNSELEYNTNSAANAALDGHGHLVITARAAAPGLSCWYGPCRYTSARLVTLGHFSQAYGQISARIKIPGGSGIWPSFWALGDNFASAGWPTAGQMDIMTSTDGTAAAVSAGLIGPGLNAWSGDTLPAGTFAGGYHTFAADWYPDHVSFYVDGHLYGTQYRIKDGAGWVFDHPFFLILNLAVGGTQPGAPTAATTFPQQMLVDWVRVYQAGPPATAATGAITGLAGKCAQASSSGAAQLSQCNGSAAQTWTIGTDGTIRALGQCLAVTGTANGTRTRLSACNGTAAQAWQAETNGQLVNTESGRCLDSTSKSSTNGTPLQIWDCWGAPNQLWNLP